MMTRERFRRRRAGVRTVVVSSTYEVLVQPVTESTRWEDLRRGRWQAQVTYVPEPGSGGGGDPAIVGTAHARTVDEAVHAGRALALSLEHGPITNAGAVTNLGPITVWTRVQHTTPDPPTSAATAIATGATDTGAGAR
jgi:hypothetical protein